MRDTVYQGKVQCLVFSIGIPKGLIMFKLKEESIVKECH